MKPFGYFTLLALLCLSLSACSGDSKQGVSIYFVESAQFEIVTPQGWRILLDVANPGQLTSPPTEKDVLLVTHYHDDHYNKDFVESFPGQKLVVEEGQLQVDGVTIRGIAAGHNSQDEFLPQGGTNYIFIVDVAGLRLAHFGDIGQEALTPEQLAALGEVDIAMTQLVNSYSRMDIFNMKGFNLMEQLHPRLIIPTHSSLDATKKAVARWGGYVNQQPIFITKTMLPEKTAMLFLGGMADSYQTIFDLPALKP